MGTPKPYVNPDSISKVEQQRKRDSIQTVKEANFLMAIHEPDLKKINHETYRIIWQFAFEPGPASGRLIRIEATDSGKYITTRWYKNGYVGGTTKSNMHLYNDTVLHEFRRTLYPDGWYDIKTLIDGSYFWSRPTRDGREGFDGWDLIIEGAKFNKDSNKMVYHKIMRWSPESDAILAIYHKFLELSGVYSQNEKGQWEERQPADYRY